MKNKQIKSKLEMMEPPIWAFFLLPFLIAYGWLLEQILKLILYSEAKRLGKTTLFDRLFKKEC